MDRMQDKLITKAASLLHRKPSTDSDDYPRIPQYYLREVFNYTDRTRKAAILMREAADRITKLEEIRNFKDIHIGSLEAKLKEFEDSDSIHPAWDYQVAENEKLEAKLKQKKGMLAQVRLLHDTQKEENKILWAKLKRVEEIPNQLRDDYSRGGMPTGVIDAIMYIEEAIK